jgi:hypothetical protein
VKWGAVFAGLYLLVSIPCAVAYLLDRHEYSIPMFIVVYASFPVHFLLFEVLRSVTIPIERLPCGEVLGVSIVVALTACLYFAVGQAVGWAVRGKASGAVSQRERSS